MCRHRSGARPRICNLDGLGLVRRFVAYDVGVGDGRSNPAIPEGFVTGRRPGYYRPEPFAPIRYWDGNSWGRRYWSWWRVAATIATVGFALFLQGSLMAAVFAPGYAMDLLS